MSRESRLIAILIVIAAVGVTGLMVIANQYRKALEHSEVVSDSERAARLVDGYLAAREAVKVVLARSPDTFREKTTDAEDIYRAERSSALAAYGMTEGDYAAVRTAWRRFRVGGRLDDPALAAVFQARRAALEAVDDAIK
jgi:hypothetical protein